MIVDIGPLNSQADERTGYPTQKPVALLKRILMASSNENDVVLDPFCGCGTAVIAAQELKRRWIGIDITHLAVSVLKRRMEKNFPDAEYRVRGEPHDAESARTLAHDKPLEFQAWIVDRVGGIPVGLEKEKKVAKGGGDDNRDGFVLFRDDPKATRSRRMLLSVKAGESYTTKPEIVDALGGALTRHGATCGALLVSHKPSDGTYKRAAGYHSWSSETYAPDRKYPVIQIVTVDDIFSSGWRGLVIPGENTSLRSQPPPGTPGASEELFDASGQPKQRPRPGGKKTSAPPVAPGQIPIPGVPKAFRLSSKRSGK
jgi:site-specific DNA-methyltransferase (adenine-specific)